MDKSRRTKEKTLFIYRHRQNSIMESPLMMILSTLTCQSIDLGDRTYCNGIRPNAERKYGVEYKRGVHDGGLSLLAGVTNCNGTL